MAGFGIFGTKKKAGTAGTGAVKKGVGEVDSTGYTEKQKKALVAGKKNKALSAVEEKRKAMAAVMGDY